MPAYNEAKSIKESISYVKEEFESFSPDFEIVVVDDGSQDKTREIVQELTDDTLRLVSYRTNRGKGHALKIGSFRATGQFMFLFDSDSEIKPVEVKAYLDGLKSADIVIGSKRHPLSVVHTPPMRRFLSIGFNILERLLTGIKATDTQAGVKAVRSVALYKLLPLLSVKKYAFDAELLAVATLLGLEVKELPVCVELRATFSARQIFRMLVDLMGIAYRLRIIHWYQKNMERFSETYKPIITW